jgi:hypothetical protein
MDALGQVADEGRDSGETPRGAAKGVDPGVPEWGNPARVMPGHPSLNS